MAITGLTQGTTYYFRIVAVNSGGTTNGPIFSIVAPPTITLISPNGGLPAGGTTVTITGASLAGTTSVKFDGTEGTTLTNVNGTSITVVTPAHVAGAVDVVLTAAGGSVTSSGGFTYRAAPAVTAVSPNGGLPAGGTVVTISGTGFATGATVKFDGDLATSVTVNSDTSITATTPAHVVGAVAVVVTNSDTQTGTLASGFTYRAAPTVISVTPSSGPVADGTVVTISGTGFVSPATVKFGVTDATGVTVNSGSSITARAPAGTGTVNVVVTNPDTQVGTLTNGYTYVAAPTITTVAPSSGPAAGSTSVTITGTNLSGTTSVTFGGTAGTAVTVVNATSVTVVTPAHAAGLVDVVLTTVGGEATAIGSYTFVAAPTITTVAPSSGPAAGGTTVTITGTNLTGTTSVTFGGTAGTAVTVVNATSVTAVTPVHAAGAVNVILTTVGGADTKTNGFTFVAAPTITSLSPTNGPIGGGTSVVITGTNLTSTVSVTFGGTAATSFTNVSATSVTAVTPANSAGAVAVILTTAGGSDTSTFTYFAVPTISVISPSNGPSTGSTTVTITGTNLTGTTGVTFGGTAGTAVTVLSPTSVTVVTPAHAAGAFDVVLTTPGGEATSPTQYTYVATPTITSISPVSGPIAGGTTVTITGTNLNGTTLVTFGARDGTSLVNVSATSITVVNPSHAAGFEAPVIVTTPGGSSNSLTYTYVAAPTITSLSQISGPAAGSTTLTITGTNLTGTTAVTFGGTAGTLGTVTSTSVIVATPAHVAGQFDVVLTTPGGPATSPGGYTFVAAPTITSVTPSSGLAVGGTSVTITGTNLTSTTAVTFGDTAAVSFTNVSATSVTAVSPAKTAGAVAVILTTAGGSDTSTFTYIGIPTISAISPSSGPADGGTTVTITGTNLSGTTSVTFGGTAGTSISNVSATSVTVVTPTKAAGAVDVILITPGGTATSPSNYTFVAAPTITGFSSSSGPAAGGTTVTITGTNLSGTTSVTFDGTAGTSISNVSATSVTVITPAHAAGPVNVVLSTVGGTATATNGFTFIAPPTITTVAPSSGSTNGGTTVTITGTNLTGTSSVTFGGLAGTSVTVVSATSVTVITPAGTVGAQDIVLTTPIGGSATSTGGFIYVGAPTITGISPATGTTGGGTTVTITGTNLTGTSGVTFGGTAGTPIVNSSATSITVVTPAHAAGAVDVVLTTPIGGSATSTGGFTFGTPPSATTVTPATSIGTTTATLGGSANANGTSTTVSFEYGTAANLSGSTTVSATPSTVSGSIDTSVSVALSGLNPGTTYFFRVVASSVYGTATGSIVSFTTGVVAATGSLSVVAGDGLLVGTVSVQTNGAVVNAIDYQVDGGAFVTTGLTASGTFTITGLTNGTSYSIVIRVTSSGVGSPKLSSAVSGTPAVAPTTTTSTTTTIPVTTTTTTSPPAPSAASASVGLVSGDGVLVGTVSSVETNGSTVSGIGYRINGGDWIDTGLTGVGTFTIGSLVNDTTYSIEIRILSNGVGSPIVLSAIVGTPAASTSPSTTIPSPPNASPSTTTTTIPSPTTTVPRSTTTTTIPQPVPATSTTVPTPTTTTTIAPLFDAPTTITASDGATIMQMDIPQTSGSPDSAPIIIAVVVPPAANTENLVWNMMMSDRVQQSTINEGYMTIEVTANMQSGDSVTSLDAPIAIMLPAPPLDGVLAFSRDGITWTLIPQLLVATLPEGQEDGYFVEADGSITLLTRHLTGFGIRKPQAPLELVVAEVDIVSGSVSRATATGGTSEDPVRYETMSDPSICKVTDSGLIYGLNAGTCTVFATRGGGSIYLNTSSSTFSTTVVSSITPLVPSVANMPLILQIVALIALCVLLGILGNRARLTISGYRSNSTKL
ncbi:MAG: IPT/TIG domain-containing protein [Ilumatobacteraceae bacterium]